MRPINVHGTRRTGHTHDLRQKMKNTPVGRVMPLGIEGCIFGFNTRKVRRDFVNTVELRRHHGFIGPISITSIDAGCQIGFGSVLRATTGTTKQLITGET